MKMENNHYGETMSSRENLDDLPTPEEVQIEVNRFLDELGDDGDGSFDREPRRPIPPSGQSSLRRKSSRNSEKYQRETRGIFTTKPSDASRWDSKRN